MGLEQFNSSMSGWVGTLWSAYSDCWLSMHPKSSLIFDTALCVGLVRTAPTPFSPHSTMEVGSSRSSGATSTCPTPLPFLYSEATSTGPTGGRTLWREQTSGPGKMWPLSRKRALSHLTCRSSIPAGSHKVKTAYLASFFFLCKIRGLRKKKWTLHCDS